MIFDQEYVAEKRSQVRKISVEKVDDRDLKYSAGFTLYIPMTPNTAQLVDLNINEIREWGEYMVAFAKEHENK